MNHFLAKSFHQKTNPDFVGFVDTKKSQPDKTYPRFPKVYLPTNFTALSDLETVLAKRASSRELIKANLTVQDISTLLKKAAGERLDLKRPYPSPGGKNSLEIYLAVQSPLNDLNKGVYHYNIKDHALEQLLSGDSTGKITSCFKYEWAQRAPLVLIITSALNRLSGKYGDFGYRLALLEAGHLSQNLILVAEALNLKHCVVSGLLNQELDNVLDLNETEEISIVSVVIGK